MAHSVFVNDVFEEALPFFRSIKCPVFNSDKM
jgi:hypothetical protein